MYLRQDLPASGPLIKVRELSQPPHAGRLARAARVSCAVRLLRAAGRAGGAALAGVTILLLATRGLAADPAQPAGRGQGELAPAAASAPAPLPGDSVYNLDSTWSDQDGARVPLATLRGQPRLVAMIYTSCQYECPLLVDEMQRVERALPPAVRKQVRFALFSFDPDRDSVTVLKAYAAKRSLDEVRWRLYTGSPDAVLELAAVLGVRFRKEPDGDFSHSTIITVLDREGVMRAQTFSLTADRKPLVQALAEAARP